MRGGSGARLCGASSSVLSSSFFRLLLPTKQMAIIITNIKTIAQATQMATISHHCMPAIKALPPLPFTKTMIWKYIENVIFVKKSLEEYETKLRINRELVHF
jgi:hypothetical protein